MLTTTLSRRIRGKSEEWFARAGRVVFLSLLGLFAATGILPANGPAKELPLLVTVTDLAKEPGAYDGLRVVVTGRVLSMEIQTGRRGSEFLMLVLEEDAPSTPSSGVVQPVQVFSPTIPKVHRGDRALVQGVFHVEGMQAGRFFEHFVDAEAILQN